MDILVSTDGLAGALDAGRTEGAAVRVVDATAFLPGTGRDAAAEFAAGHVPGAVFLDLDSLRDPDDPRPAMLPPAALFEARMRALGIDAQARIVVYDDSPIRTAARAWWMLRLFGLRRVAILDGGLAKWRAEGRPLERGEATCAPAAFTASPDLGGVRTKGDVIDALARGTAQVVDARGAARFTGDEPDPRAGVAAGHIQGSRNLHYARLFAPDGTYRRGDALRAMFEEAGVDLSRPVVTTCGSGITAAVPLVGMALLGKADVGLYDGSWSEWGADPTTPKAIGAAA